MLASTQQFVTTMDAKGVKYTYHGTTENGKDRITLAYSCENAPSVRVSLFFDDDNRGAALRVFNLVKFPEEKLDPMMRQVCDLNNRFRFVKFCIDFDDNTVQAEMDGVFRDNDVGEICMELIARCVQICDDAYPDLMKSVWA